MILPQICSIFGAYGIIETILKPNDKYFSSLLLNGVALVFNHILIIPTVHSGSSLSASAEEFIETFSLSANELDGSDAHKLELIYLMTKIKSRNVKLQNFLFVIDWNILLAVSFVISVSFVESKKLSILHR